MIEIDNDLATQHLEAIYVLIILLQQQDLLFPNKGVNL